MGRSKIKEETDRTKLQEGYAQILDLQRKIKYHPYSKGISNLDKSFVESIDKDINYIRILIKESLCITE